MPGPWIVTRRRVGWVATRKCRGANPEIISEDSGPSERSAGRFRKGEPKMPEFLCASLDMRVCDEGHVHINLKAHDNEGCPTLGIALETRLTRARWH